MDRETLYNEVEHVLARHTRIGDAGRIYVCAEMLMHAFSWYPTPQGYDYWRGIYHELIELADARGGSSSTPNNQTQTTSGVGATTSIANVLMRVEQLLLDVKATVEAESAKPEQAKKLMKFMTYALHQLEGRESLEQRGLVEKLKDAS